MTPAETYFADRVQSSDGLKGEARHGAVQYNTWITDPAPADSAERRQVMVLFSDLVGSTALAKRLRFGASQRAANIRHFNWHRLFLAECDPILSEEFQVECYVGNRDAIGT